MTTTTRKPASKDPSSLPDSVGDSEQTIQSVEIVTVADNINVRVRKRPSLNAPVIRIAKGGSVLEALGYTDGWVQISDGYIRVEYLK